MKLPENLSTSSWLSIGLGGILTFMLGEWFALIIPLNYTFLGLLGFSASVVGISTHLSEATRKPHYNLWTRIKAFASQHKLACSGLGLGILMLNPIFALSSFTLATFAEKFFPRAFRACDDIFNRCLTYLAQRSVSEHFEHLQQQVVDYCKNNPAKSLAYGIGGVLGLTLFWYSLPLTGVAMQWIYQFNFYTLDAIAQGLASTFSGGTIPYLLIKSIAHTLDEIMTAFLAASFTIAGGWSANRTRLLVEAKLATVKAKVEPKYVASRNFLSLQYQKVQQVAQKIKQTAQQVKQATQSIYRKGIALATLVVNPRQWLSTIRRTPAPGNTLQAEYLAYLHAPAANAATIEGGETLAEGENPTPSLTADDQSFLSTPANDAHPEELPSICSSSQQASAGSSDALIGTTPPMGGLQPVQLGPMPSSTIPSRVTSPAFTFDRHQASFLTFAALGQPNAGTQPLPTHDGAYRESVAEKIEEEIPQMSIPLAAANGDNPSVLASNLSLIGEEISQVFTTPAPVEKQEASLSQVHTATEINAAIADPAAPTELAAAASLPAITLIHSPERKGPVTRSQRQLAQRLVDQVEANDPPLTRTRKYREKGNP